MQYADGPKPVAYGTRAPLGLPRGIKLIPINLSLQHPSSLLPRCTRKYPFLAVARPKARRAASDQLGNSACFIRFLEYATRDRALVVVIPRRPRARTHATQNYPPRIKCDRRPFGEIELYARFTEPRDPKRGKYVSIWKSQFSYERILVSFRHSEKRRFITTPLYMTFWLFCMYAKRRINLDNFTEFHEIRISFLTLNRINWSVVA